MQLPPFSELMAAVRKAIRTAKANFRPSYIALSYERAPAGEYTVQEKISGSAFLVVGPTGFVFCLRAMAAELDRQVRQALLAEG